MDVGQEEKVTRQDVHRRILPDLRSAIDVDVESQEIVTHAT